MSLIFRLLVIVSVLLTAVAFGRANAMDIGERVNDCVADAIARLDKASLDPVTVVNLGFEYCRPEIRLLINSQVAKGMSSSEHSPDKIKIDSEVVTVLEKQITDKMRPIYVERLKLARRLESSTR